MAHKELKYDAEARKALEEGVDAVANAVKVTPPRKAVTSSLTRSSAPRRSPTMV